MALAAFCRWQKGYFLSGQTGRDCSVTLGQPLRRRSRSLVQTRRGAGPGEAHKQGIKETKLEHEAARWLSYDELDDVDWLPADRVVVGSLREYLSAYGN